jgi:hypothetical protein
MTTISRTGLRLLRVQDGVSMLIALGVMLATSLLIAVVLTAASGDAHLSHTDTLQKQAYYAALAGIQEYQSELNQNADYWETCPQPAAEIGENSAQRYEVAPVPASGSACNPESPFTSMINSGSGPLANSFRIESVGCAGETGMTTCKGHSASKVQKRTLIATFQVTGFLDYAYFSQYEDPDPILWGTNPKECEKYRSERPASCETIYWAAEDSVNGPVHTDDTAVICGKVSFGQPEHTPPDKVEFVRGMAEDGCRAEPTFYTKSKEYEETKNELEPPPNDSSLKAYVESEYDFKGATHLELDGSTLKVTVENGKTLTPAREMAWPKNGLIFVEASSTGVCTFDYKQTENGSDNSNEEKEETGCGIVYVKGEYSKSLTIGGEKELVINGNVLPSGTSAGVAPGGTATLGLIASKYVRFYHTCGSSETLAVDAALLSTAHSVIDDNFDCGSPGLLDLYGALAQKFRGVMGQFSGSGIVHGLQKDYHYDRRLATDEPPFFLSPLKSGWRVIRETGTNPG